MCGRCRDKSNMKRSRYNPQERRAPGQAPNIVVQTVPRRSSVFRDAAAVAGGVTVGTTMGHIAGEAITSLFTGPRRHEVEQVLPRDFEYSQAPSGPCAYEINTFLQCATSVSSLTECQQFGEALKDCKRRNGIP